MDRDTIRGKLNRYTALAFSFLPALDHPRVLDIGCGTGVPTIHLAELSNGHITGIDSDANAIAMLQKKIRQQHLEKQVVAQVCSFNCLPFLPESFNLVWSEGVIAFKGFRAGLYAWGGLVKKGGFLVIHDEIRDLPRKVEMVHDSPFTLSGYFVLYENIWERDYCRPLRELLANEPDYGNTEDGKRATEEMELFRTDPESFRSVFYIIRKGD